MPYDPATPSHKRNAYTCSTSDIYKNVHSSTIHNSQKLETTQTFTNSRMDKHITKYPNSWKLQANKNKLLLHGWISQIKCWAKEPKHKRVHSIWFHLY